MAQLLVLTAVLVALSGLVKIRSGLKAGIGVSIPTVVELLAAVALVGLVAGGAGSASVARWAIPGGVVLVIVSSVGHIVRVGAHRRDREARLGARLESYVKHRSGPPAEERPP